MYVPGRPSTAHVSHRVDLVLIPNGTTKTRGIGLLETMCKVVETMIYTRLCIILQMQNVLHGFSIRRGKGTVIMELKLAH